MVNNTDKVYQDLLKRILSEGKEKEDRTGTGTISIFSHTLEIDMSDGFPLLTCKKVFVRGIISELLWFLSGNTNIKPLVDQGNMIWVDDAYKKYCQYFDGSLENHIKLSNNECKANKPYEAIKLTKKQFIDNIKTDNQFATKWGELGPVYGKQWVNWGGYDIISGKVIEGLNKGVNQIQNAIDILKNNPDSRRIIVSAWNVGEIHKMTLPPCHWAFELYTEELTHSERLVFKKNRDKIRTWVISPTEQMLDNSDIPRRKISLKWHQRSVDTFLGLPFNIASYGLLLEMIAQQCNMVPDKLVGDLTNVHIYKNHVEQCKEQIQRQGLDLPKLELDKVDSIFEYSYDNVKILNYSSHPPIKGEISV